MGTVSGSTISSFPMAIRTKLRQFEQNFAKRARLGATYELSSVYHNWLEDLCTIGN